MTRALSSVLSFDSNLCNFGLCHRGKNLLAT